MLKDLVMEQLQAAAAATKGVGSISDDQVGPGCKASAAAEALGLQALRGAVGAR